MGTEQEIQETKDRVMAQLENVIDPELGIDIVNLGLVYDILVDAEWNVTVVMTLTSMGCPLAGVIHDQVKQTLSELQELKEIGDVDVNIVWNPPWTKDKMSRYAKIALGVAD
ncbi:metal-sulfur cluster assembly factor [Halalkalibacterium halodurans]|jgi:metal-sulfur cluster biosynthetic enzyme|uniref:BH2173 protein n=1 Tax=Halalkalibacterium halodurans (strain ATCC BAA-125 / DSM 18197 / FERM 7344 / JCM 9153 / C-125) TaxID=272558 RepID=Q9KAW3_HALH5|nr:metal-sulfur cluster assembly factor [Halalkalibacterium halodurans]MDY7222729.1 metal-sulfur cluster assembly factor [Halalkalibacterium halodurans]MDY7241950.1 metal-sulfur cluster assembly factor [Halalkalibacterium halodurans]MED3645748.1 metal-sulfur cluster assembly factor [Halalkalibacterium halodurans]MED4082785.1 metal-sulfur cluster assembly factor [Halalkalibacterium halodurans]MED4087245.1 metal-sulfur cluster assembly factor [Halalkalibacterium halodurans]